MLFRSSDHRSKWVKEYVWVVSVHWMTHRCIGFLRLFCRPYGQLDSLAQSNYTIYQERKNQVHTQGLILWMNVACACKKVSQTRCTNNNKNNNKSQYHWQKCILAKCIAHCTGRVFECADDIDTMQITQCTAHLVHSCVNTMHFKCTFQKMSVHVAFATTIIRLPMRGHCTKKNKRNSTGIRRYRMRWSAVYYNELGDLKYSHLFRWPSLLNWLCYKLDTIFFIGPNWGKRFFS